MEDLIGALLQLVVEIFGNLLLEWLIDALVGRASTAPNWTVLRAIALAGAGIALGWASVALLPRPMIPWPAARVVYIILVPVVVASVQQLWIDRRRRQGKAAGVFVNWFDAWAFAVALSLTRFLLTL